MEDRRTKFLKYIASFTLAFLCSFLFFLIRFIFLGNKDALFGDMYLQFVPVLKDFVRAIACGENIFFSFRSCLGINNIFNISYTCLSPFNLIYLLFYYVDDNVVTFIVFSLKVATSATSYLYFSNKVLKNFNIFALIVSVYYACCSYAFVYGLNNIMWLDAIIILPIIVVGIINCLENNKRVLLIISYFYLFISQFYIGYMVGILSFCFVVLYLVIVKREVKFSLRIKLFFNWLLSAFIAVLMSAVIWSPTLFYILANRVEDSTLLINYSISIFHFLNSAFWGLGYSIQGSFAYIYCGILTLVCAFLFLLDKGIEKKIKILVSSMMVLVLIFLLFPILNYFLHAFDQADSCWFRYSFIFSFLLCTCASIYLKDKREIKKRNIFIVLSSLISVYVIMLFVFKYKAFGRDFVLNDIVGLFINVFLILIFLFLINKWNTNKRILSYLIILVSVLEIVSNHVYIFKSSNRLPIVGSYKSVLDDTINDIYDSDNDLYRITCANIPFVNADSYFGYNGISDFGNQQKYKVRSFLSNMGYASSTRTVDDCGFSPVSNMLLGVKYIVDAYDDGNHAYTNVNKNDYFLGIGYIVSPDAPFYVNDCRNVFEYQNSLVNVLSGVKFDCYDRVDTLTFYENGLSVDCLEDGRYLFSKESNEGVCTIEADVPSESYSDVYIQFEVSNPTKYSGDLKIWNSQNMGYVYDNYASMSASNKMKFNPETKMYELTIYCDDLTDDFVVFDSINVYALNREALGLHYSLLSKDQLIVSQFKNGFVKGNINVSGDSRFMLTTIPYDPGWSAYINGMEAVPVRTIEGTFIGLYLPKPGTYEIELRYECPGLKIGLIVSTCGILAFLSVVFEKRLKGFKRKDKGVDCMK